MENLLNNIYGDTLRKICEDLLAQIEGYDDYDRPLDKEDIDSLNNLKELVREPLAVYNENYNFQLTSACPLYIAYKKYK